MALFSKIMENNSHNFINRPFIADTKPSIKTPIQINHKYFVAFVFVVLKVRFALPGQN